MRRKSARRGDPALPTKPGSAAAVTVLGDDVKQHTKAHSLVKCFRDVKGVDLMGLSHDGILGLDVAFRHGVCAAVMSPE